MASFLLGDEYGSSSSSSDDESLPCVHLDNGMSTHTAAASTMRLLPSPDELFSSDTSSVLTTSIPSAQAPPANKRRNEQASKPVIKKAKNETGEAVCKPKIALFAPPQLRRPNISTEDRSAWNTNKTLALQKKAKEMEA